MDIPPDIAPRAQRGGTRGEGAIRMQRTTVRWLGVVVVLVAAMGLSASVATGAGSRQIPSAGSTSPVAGPSGVDGLAWPEFPLGEDSDEQGPEPFSGTIVNRAHSHGNGHGGTGHGKKAGSNPELQSSFDGLNARQQRLANGGNQFTVEPPDQGLCVGNGFVLESVNTVLRAHTTDGTPASGTVDLNSFYGYPAQIDRGVDPPTIGPFTTDPSCLFDED